MRTGFPRWRGKPRRREKVPTNPSMVDGPKAACEGAHRYQPVKELSRRSSIRGDEAHYSSGKVMKSEPANERFAKCGVGLRPAGSGNLWFPDTTGLDYVSGNRALREAATVRSETCPTPRCAANRGREFDGIMPHLFGARILLPSAATPEAGMLPEPRNPDASDFLPHAGNGDGNGELPVLVRHRGCKPSRKY